MVRRVTLILVTLGVAAILAGCNGSSSPVRPSAPAQDSLLSGGTIVNVPEKTIEVPQGQFAVVLGQKISVNGTPLPSSDDLGYVVVMPAANILVLRGTPGKFWYGKFSLNDDNTSAFKAKYVEYMSHNSALCDGCTHAKLLDYT